MQSGNAHTRGRRLLGHVAASLACSIITAGCTPSSGPIEPRETTGAPTAPTVTYSAPPRPSKETLAIYDSLGTWEPESRPLYKRQRPALLIVVCDDYGSAARNLSVPSVTGIEMAKRLAHCGYDVSILVGIPVDATAREHHTVGFVCREIAKLNEELARRNRQEVALGRLPDRVAPLRSLPRPETFCDATALRKKVESWFRATFDHNLVRVTPKDFNLAFPATLADVAPDEGRRNRVSPPVYVVDSRPPFGAVYLCGHGGVDPLRGLLYVAPADDPSAPSASLSVNDIAEFAAKTCLAPIWIVPDVCRGTLRATAAWPPVPPPPGEAPNARTVFSYDAVASRSLPPDVQEALRTIEELRTRGKHISTHFSEPRQNNATMLIPDKDGLKLFDSVTQTFGHQLADVLQTAQNDDGTQRYFSAFETHRKIRPRPKLLTLRTLFEEAGDRLVNRGMSPHCHHGPVNDLMVVASTERGFSYPRIRRNLVAGNLAVDVTRTGFTVGCDSKGQVQGEVIEIRRDQTQYDDNFKASVTLGIPADLPEADELSLVVDVAATAENDSDRFLKFVVGAYNGQHKLLTDEFVDYGKAQSVLSPIPCDGTRHLRIVSLDLLRDSQQSLHSLEFQAIPHPKTGRLPESDDWPLSATLSVFGAYLVPKDASVDVVFSEIHAQEAYRDQLSLLRQWWPTTAWVTPRGRGKPTVKAVLESAGGGVGSLIISSEGIDTRSWGIVGTLYPRRQVRSRIMRLFLRCRGHAKASPDAEVAIVVYGDSKVLAATRTSLSAASRGISIPIEESGVPAEIAVLCRGASQLVFDQMYVESADVK